MKVETGQTLYKEMLEERHMFLPPFSRCPAAYLRKLESGEKKCILAGEVLPFDPAKYKGVTLKMAMKKWGSLVKDYLPECSAGAYPDRTFVLTIVHTLTKGKESIPASPKSSANSRRAKEKQQSPAGLCALPVLRPMPMLPMIGYRQTPPMEEPAERPKRRKEAEEEKANLRPTEDPPRKFREPEFVLDKDVKDWVMARYPSTAAGGRVSLGARDLKDLVSRMDEDVRVMADTLYRTWCVPKGYCPFLSGLNKPGQDLFPQRFGFPPFVQSYHH